MNGASQESVPAKMRRQFTASEKLRLVKNAEVAFASGERGALEALLQQAPRALTSAPVTTSRSYQGALPTARAESRATINLLVAAT